MVVLAVAADTAFLGVRLLSLRRLVTLEYLGTEMMEALVEQYPTAVLAAEERLLLVKVLQITMAVTGLTCRPT
jgi:hypothetical protein